ncbi:MAG: glycosyltransferase family 25 protein [Hyphomicrobiaceae bacterium]
MFSLDAALALIPDLAIDLSRCGEVGPHGLPPPVVVTLERRPDRWAAAQQRLARHGILHPIKATAVDGRALTGDQLRRLLADPSAVDRPLEHYLQMTRPAVGCFLSHLAIWKQFLGSGAPHILVLEDDAVPVEGYAPGQGRAVLRAMPDDADMLLLGYTIMDGLAEPTANLAITRVYYYNGTYAYLLTRKGCLALLPHLLPLVTHVDNQISLALVAQRAMLRVYGAEPRLFEHDFTILSDVYVPVTNEATADRRLALIFDDSRARLIRDGARLQAKFVAHDAPSLTD